MISLVSTLLSKKLLKKGLISDEEHELCKYAFFMISSYCLFLVIAIFLGFLVNIPLLSFVFYITFCVIRNFAGGIHAKSESRCLVYTTTLIILSILVIKKIIVLNCLWFVLLMMFFSMIIIVFLSPVDTPNKKLSSLEKSLYRRKTIILVTIITSIFIVMLVMKITSIAVALSVAMTLAAILVVIGKIKQNIENCKGKSA